MTNQKVRKIFYVIGVGKEADGEGLFTTSLGQRDITWNRRRSSEGRRPASKVLKNLDTIV